MTKRREGAFHPKMTRASYYKASMDQTGLKTVLQSASSEREIRTAWETFVTSDHPDGVKLGHVRADILASWQRSMDLGWGSTPARSALARFPTRMKSRCGESETCICAGPRRQRSNGWSRT